MNETPKNIKKESSDRTIAFLLNCAFVHVERVVIQE